MNNCHWGIAYILKCEMISVRMYKFKLRFVICFFDIFDYIFLREIKYLLKL